MRRIYFLLIVIVIIASALRFYRLDSAPASISWDEASVGYNAWTIANYGRDEYGKLFPAYFRSFGDDKHPVHVYATAISVKLLGLSEFSTRLPSAIFGILNVILIFFLARLLFKNDILALAAAFFLAISPYSIHFSRFNHEANLALAFFMLGLILFFLSLKEKKGLLPLSALSFGITFLTYHPSKIMVPTVVILLVVLYGKQVLKNRIGLLGVFAVGLVFFLLIFFNPGLLGIARINQTSLSKESIVKTKLYKLTHNEFLGRINLTFIQYTWHFSINYLFVSGDKNSRLSDQATGEFYRLDALFLLFGLAYLFFKRSKEGFVLLVWALIAPIPSALVAEAPHAARAMYMMGSWHLISAVGFYFVLNLLRKPILKAGFAVASVTILLFLLYGYLNYYYGEFVKRYAIDWQYGMKQIVEYVKDQQEYTQIFMTEERSQPYIFFLYYLKTPLSEYLNSVIYNNSISKSHSTVSFYDRYYFGGWDPIESFPNKGVLYILTPSQYDGLRYKLVFETKKIIYYPNGITAYFIVTAK